MSFMNLNKEQLIESASKHGYRIEIVEKVVLLSQLLENIFKLPLLNESFALKGGTALNLFYFKDMPRLSVDIDLNYVKAVNREAMLQDRELAEDAIIRICNQVGCRIRRHPKSHAGGKMTLIYPSILGHEGKLEVDLNYMYRNPIFGIQKRNSHNWPYKVEDIPILDVHELTAGKLHALFTRNAARDLFDIHQLLSTCDFDKQKLKIAFVVYIAMSKTHWKDFNLNNVNFDVRDIKNKLVPVIKKNAIVAGSEKELRVWAVSLLDEVKDKLDASIFPFTSNEQKFLHEIQEHGKIYPELICSEDATIKTIKSHPNLMWRIRNKK